MGSSLPLQIANYLLLTAFFFGSFHAMGQKPKESLYQFSFETLNSPSTKVTTASKEEELQKDASAIISVITKKEIEEFGHLSLFEILERAPSIYNMGTVFHPANMVSIRGDNTIHYNSRVLFLLNGRPMRESLQGGTHMAILRVFPVSNIERIEIIRGPGSVLYGTGAYTGVINIITSEVGGKTLSFRVLGGGDQRIQLQLNAGFSVAKIPITIGANLFKDQGWDFTSFEEPVFFDGISGTWKEKENPLSRTIKMKNEGVGLNLNTQIKDLSITSYFGINRQTSMYFTGLWIPSELISGNDTTLTYLDYWTESKWFFTDLQYQKRINEKWRFSVNATFNLFGLDEFRIPSNDDIARGYSFDQLLEFTHFISLSKKHNLTIGGLVNNINGKQVLPEGIEENTFETYPLYNLNIGRNPTPRVIVDSYDKLLYSFYLQGDINIKNNFKITYGGQLNKVPDLKVNIVPRIGMVYNYSPLIGAKLLFGSAYRSASQNELSISFQPIIEGNRNLLPETISTTEGQLFFNSLSNNMKAAFTVYHSQQNNVISRGFNPEIEADTYFNSGERVLNGIELEGSYQPVGWIEINLSYTYQQNKDINHGNSRTNTTGVPHHMIKNGWTFLPVKWIKIGVFNTYFSPASFSNYQTTSFNTTTLEVEVENFPKEVNPKAREIILTDVQGEIKLEEIFHYRKFSGGKLGFYIKNLWNQQVMMPEYTRQIINSVPARPGRNIYIWIRWNLNKQGNQ